MEALCPVSKVTEYTINGTAVTFMPTDLTWVEQFMHMVESIEARIPITQEEQKAIDEDPKAVFAVARRRDRDIREEIDRVFGDGAASAIYPGNMMTLSEGLPIWLNFVLTIMDKIEAVMNEQQSISGPRIDKYTAKFQKYQRK